MKTSVLVRELWHSNQVIKEGELEVYTDDSKTSEGTGSGVFIEELSLDCQLS